MMKYLLISLLALIPAAAAAQSVDINFAIPVVTAPAEAPGVWYPDRYAPCGFVSPVKAPDGTKNTLQQNICSTDYQGVDSFYNTQGRKYDLPPNTYSVSISLYVPSAWKTENARMAGFWATAFDSSNNVGDYPIIEFEGPTTSDLGGPGYRPNGGVAGFYGWDNSANSGAGAFVLIGLPKDFKYNSWVDLTMTLLPGKGIEYTVSDSSNHHGLSLLTKLYDTADVNLGNVFMQGYNYDSLDSYHTTMYSIFWDNLNFSSKSLICVSDDH